LLNHVAKSGADTATPKLWEDVNGTESWRQILPSVEIVHAKSGHAKNFTVRVRYRRNWETVVVHMRLQFVYMGFDRVIRQKIAVMLEASLGEREDIFRVVG